VLAFRTNTERCCAEIAVIFSKDKFKTLVHYICWRCEDPDKLGAIKLNKVLWFADTIAFCKTGKPITGVQYVKQKFGPVPKPILPILRELATERKLLIQDIPFYGKTKRHYISLRDPDFSTFTAEQLEIIDDVLKTIVFEHSAESISDLTHDRVWKLAEVGETIPHFAALACQLGKINEDDIAWAKTRLDAYNAAA
jgi:hypothetical protein